MDLHFFSVNEWRIELLPTLVSPIPDTQTHGTHTHRAETQQQSRQKHKKKRNEYNKKNKRKRKRKRSSIEDFATLPMMIYLKM